MGLILRGARENVTKESGSIVVHRKPGLNLGFLGFLVAEKQITKCQIDPDPMHKRSQRMSEARDGRDGSFSLSNLMVNIRFATFATKSQRSTNHRFQKNKKPLGLSSLKKYPLVI